MRREETQSVASKTHSRTAAQTHLRVPTVTDVWRLWCGAKTRWAVRRLRWDLNTNSLTQCRILSCDLCSPLTCDGRKHENKTPESEQIFSFLLTCHYSQWILNADFCCIRSFLYLSCLFCITNIHQWFLTNFEGFCFLHFTQIQKHLYQGVHFTYTHFQ